jgi:cyclophilin family peptidyl-prolyl cis-trans isomerase
MTRHRLLTGLALAVAVPALVAACSSGGGGASAIPTIPPATPAASGAAASPSVDPMAHPTFPPGCPKAQPDALGKGETRTITMETEKGTIVMKITADLSPIATGNFVALSDCGFYDGVVFHRLVPGFVIQGGDGQFGRKPNVIPDLVGTGGPNYTIKDEPVTSKYHRGTVAMARSAQPNSVGSQFFIVLTDEAASALANPQYNNYQIVGEVTTGMDVVDTIAAMPNDNGPGNAAIDPVAISKATVATP